MTSTVATKKYHGAILQYRDGMSSEEKKIFSAALPKRTDFIDITEHNLLIEDLKAGKPVLFHPNDVIDNHSHVDGKLAYRPILIGILRDGSKASVILKAINVDFELQIPEDADSWSFKNSVQAVLKEAGVYPRDITTVQRLPGKGFKENPIDYLKLSFGTQFQRKKAIEALRFNPEGPTISIGYKRKEKFGGTGILNKPGGPYAQTARDDLSCNYRKYARENKINLTGWNWIKSYTVIRDDTYTRRALVPYCFELDIKHMIPIDPSIDITRPTDCPVLDPTKDQAYKDLMRDKTLMCGWDLETTSRHSTGGVPEPIRVFGPDGLEEDTVFLECLTFGWHSLKKPFLTVSISTKPVPSLPSCITIQCAHQSELIKIKALVLERMCPDILSAFNDGTYDWPFILRRAEAYKCNIAGMQYPLTEFMKMHMSCLPYDPSVASDKFKVRGEYKEKIKLEAGDMPYEPTVFQYPGTICIDVRGIFMKLYPRADKSNLNFYLSQNKLKSKEDMPVINMFRAVHLLDLLSIKSGSTKYDDCLEWLKASPSSEERPCRFDENAPIQLDPSVTNYGLEKLSWDECIKLIGGPEEGGKVSEGVGMIVNYCNEDARKCPELLLVRNIISDKRIMASISYTSMFDALYRADGIRVCNLVMANAVEPEWNLAFSNIGGGKKDDRKYPGAYVVSPKKGLYRDHKLVKKHRRKKNKSHDSINYGASGMHVEGREEDVDFRENVNPQSPKFDKSLLDLPDSFDRIHILKEEEELSTAAKKNGNDEFDRVSVDENNSTDRPCTGLDFSSLYPSLIMTYDLSSEKVVLEYDEMKRLQQKGYEFEEPNFKYGLKDQPEDTKENILAWIVQHRHPARAILMEERTRAIAAAISCGHKGEHDWFKFINKDVVNRVTAMYKETTLKQWRSYGMGIYPYILKGLFDRRAKVKKSMEHFSEPKEFFNKVLDELFTLKEFEKLDLPSQKKKLLELVDVEITTRKAEFEKTKKGFHKWKLSIIESTKEFFVRNWVDPGSEYFELSVEELFEEMAFKINYFNSNQLGLKVYMNTFYGVAGNQMSPLFIISVAGGVTQYGRLNIKRVKSFVESEGYNVLYGDTDSLYTTPPEMKFESLDREYTSGKITKLEYWTRMIEITMETMDEFKTQVNSFLMFTSLSMFLTMAYEEAMLPYGLFGKKKYIGVQHQGIVNLSVCMPECTLASFMKSKSLMIRGLELIKRNSSEVLRQICFDVFRQAFAINEVRTLKQIIEDKLREITTAKWDPAMFAKSAKYKLPGINPETGLSKKGNTSVLNFMARMKDLEKLHPLLGIKAVDWGERFKYVVARRYPWKYDVRGNQVGISMADKYEFLESLSNKAYCDHIGGLEVDMDYYITNEIIGQFARFIIYHPDYDHYFKPGMDDDEYKKADEMACIYAKKVLANFYEANYAVKYVKKGKVHKNVFKAVNAYVLSSLGDSYGPAGQMFIVSNTLATKGLSKDDENDLHDLGNVNDTVDKMIKEAKQLGQKWSNPFPIGPILKNGKGGTDLQRWIRTAYKMDPFMLQTSTILNGSSYYRTQREYIVLKEQEVTKQLKDLIPEFQTVYQSQLSRLVELVDQVCCSNNLGTISEKPVQHTAESISTELDFTPNFESLQTDIEETVIEPVVYELYYVWTELITIYREIAELESFKVTVKDMRTTAVDPSAPPPSVTRRGKDTKDEFLEWISKQSLSIDSSL